MFERYREIKMRSAEGDGSESGFTLIELLIVIVVLGILAAIVVFSLTGITGQSAQAACTSNGKSIEIAAAAYQAKHSAYPTSSSELVGTYLQTWPSQTGVVFTLGSNTVDVQVGTATSAVAYTDPAGCAVAS